MALVGLTACNDSSDSHVAEATFTPPVTKTPDPVVVKDPVVIIDPDPPQPLEPIEEQAVVDQTQYTYRADSSLALTDVREEASVKHHSMTIKGKTVEYTASAGHLFAYAPKDAEGKQDPQATIFYMAYTRDDLPRENRPVTFFWNGGPGSSSFFLHMGSWAPKRLKTGMPVIPEEAKTKKPASFPWIDDEETLLDHSDLVFVDPVGTGFSEAIAPHQNQEFWGMDDDARVIKDFITRFINKYNRQSSSKYLYGESYGGIRTPIVAKLLEVAGTGNYEPDPSGKKPVVLSGIVLNSPILDYNTNTGQGGDTSSAGFLPTYAMTADWYKKGTKRQQAPASAYTDTLRDFVKEKYNPAYIEWYYPGRGTINVMADNAPTNVDAFIKWFNEPGRPEAFAKSPQFIKPSIATPVANCFIANPTDRPKLIDDFGTDPVAGVRHFADLAADVEKHANSPAWLKFSQSAPGIDLFRDMTSIIGLDLDWVDYFELSSNRFQNSIMPDSSLNPYDDRLNIPKGAYDLTFYEDDAFIAGINAALPDTFNYHSPTEYMPSNFDLIVPLWKWNRDGALAYAKSSIPDLVEKLNYDPSVKMLILHGYYDLVCPFYQTELDLANVGLANRIPVKNFEGGHMIYESEEARVPLKQELDKFYTAPPYKLSPAVAAQSVAVN